MALGEAIVTIIVIWINFHYGRSRFMTIRSVRALCAICGDDMRASGNNYSILGWHRRPDESGT